MALSPPLEQLRVCQKRVWAELAFARAFALVVALARAFAQPLPAALVGVAASGGANSIPFWRRSGLQRMSGLWHGLSNYKNDV